MRCRRIISLLPAATEVLYGLGVGSRLVGRSHECDWPPEATILRPLTTSRIDSTLSSAEIHQSVCLASTGVTAGSTTLFELDADSIVALEPDLIVTQDTCNICALPADEVTVALRRIGQQTEVLRLSATSLAGLWSDIMAVGHAVGELPRARELIARLQGRSASVATKVKALASRGTRRPRVAVIEWLDPPMAAGNWVPELVSIAGGDDCLGHQAEHSHWIDPPALAAADPDVVILSPCGMKIDTIAKEVAAPAIARYLSLLRATREGNLWGIDGHHLLNRPGPRLVDSLEVLAELLNPGQFRFAATTHFAQRIAPG